MTEHEELLKLRALVEKQAAELAAKNQIIEAQNSQIENMIQALLHARKKIFGPSIECTKQTDGQLSLFDTAQALAIELGNEQKKITVKTHNRVARKPGVREEMLAGLPKEIEEYVIPAEETCNVCGGELKVIGKRIVRTEVVFQNRCFRILYQHHRWWHRSCTRNTQWDCHWHDKNGIGSGWDWYCLETIWQTG